MTRSGWDDDVAVVGGGPGGAAAAGLLARRGRRVLLIDRETFPRFHIGESLLPWCDEVFEKLGARDLVRESGFIEKWGASFCTADATFDQYADFTSAVEVPRPQTWQVTRAAFDEMLLKHAARCGARVVQSCRATDAVFDGDGVTLTLVDSGGATRTHRVGMVVDSSGRAGFLAKRFGTRVMDPELKNIAVHAQFEGIPRAEGRRAGDIRIVSRYDVGWYWLIPLTREVTSVGVVLPQAHYNATGLPTAEQTLEKYLAETPAMVGLLREARRVSPARFDADYSYLATQHAGDRWVLVGDAGAFLDPIFSTGVLLALQGGVDAAEAIDAGLAKGDLSAGHFAPFERRVQKRYRHFRRIAVGFYDPAFRDLFFQRDQKWGIYEAILSMLAGNWRPTWKTRLRIATFFALVALQRRVEIAPRLFLRPAAA